MKKKILLTGSHGFIGTYLRKALNLKEKDCWDEKQSMNRTIFAIEPEDLKGYDTIVHLAALISGDESWDIPNEYLFTNAMGTFHIVKNAIEAGVKKIIFTSSAAIYGNPLTPYGASKKSAEAILECYQDDIGISVLRFFNVYGKGQNPQYAGVITKLIKASKEDKPFFLYGDGENTRDYIHVDDVVEIIKNSLERPAFPLPIDIGTGIGTSVNNLINIISKIAGKRLIVRQGIERKEIKQSIAANQFAQELLDRPFIKLEDGLRKLYEDLDQLG